MHLWHRRPFSSVAPVQPGGTQRTQIFTARTCWTAWIFDKIKYTYKSWEVVIDAVCRQSFAELPLLSHELFSHLVYLLCGTLLVVARHSWMPGLYKFLLGANKQSLVHLLWWDHMTWSKQSTSSSVHHLYNYSMRFALKLHDKNILKWNHLTTTLVLNYLPKLTMKICIWWVCGTKPLEYFTWDLQQL